jgi:tRNA-Thr(GGU) m(6)t(6)A37 methyltransferase TsaA
MARTAESKRWYVEEVGTVVSGRDEAIDDEWGLVESRIELTSGFGPAALAGLEGFSHVEVVFLFDRVDPRSVCRGARRPRGNPDWPEVGIFAQRAKDRPNRLGLCTCELVGVADDTLEVRGLDAIDGTPVLDIKPYMSEFAPHHAVRQPPWSHELMSGYF